MIEENLTAVPEDNEEELKEEERKLETEQQIDEAVAEQGGGQQMPPNIPQPGINIDPNIIPQIAQGANNLSTNLQQAYPEQAQQLNLLQRSVLGAGTAVRETGAAVVGGTADAVESVGSFAELTGDTIKTGLNKAFGNPVDPTQNPFDAQYIHGDGDWLDIPDDWVPENQTGMGKFARGLVEFGVLAWATGGVGGATGVGVRAAGAGVKGSKYIHFLKRGGTIAAEGGIADLISSSSELGNIANLAEEHVPWMSPWFVKALAVRPEDNPWLARIKTVASGSGMNLIGHGLGAAAKGLWGAIDAKKAGRTIDEANDIGNQIMQDDMIRSLELDEAASYELAANRYEDGYGLSKADNRDEYLRDYLSEDEYARYNDPELDIPEIEELEELANTRGEGAGDVWDETQYQSGKQAVEGANREPDFAVNSELFDNVEKATYRGDVRQHVSEAVADMKAGGDGRSYTPIASESQLRASSLGNRNVRQYFDEVLEDIQDSVFRELDGVATLDEFNQVAMLNARPLLERIEAFVDGKPVNLAESFKRQMANPADARGFKVNKDGKIEEVLGTIGPIQKATNVVVNASLGRLVSDISTGAIQIANKADTTRQADMIFDAMKVLFIENKKMGMMWGLDGQAQQKGFALTGAARRAKEAQLEKMNIEAEELFGSIKQMINDGNIESAAALYDLNRLSDGKVRILDDVYTYLQGRLTGARMDGVDIRGRFRNELQGVFYNSRLGSPTTPVKAVLGANILAIERAYAAAMGSLLPWNYSKKQMVMAAAQVDATYRSFGEAYDMFKYNWDLGVNRMGQSYQGKFDYDADIAEWQDLAKHYELFGTKSQQMAYNAADMMVKFNTSPWLKYSQNAMGAGDSAARTIIGRQYVAMKAAEQATELVDIKDARAWVAKNEELFRGEIFKKDKYGMEVVHDKAATMAGDYAALTKGLENSFVGFEHISKLPGMRNFFPFVRTGFNYLDVVFDHAGPAGIFKNKYKDLVLARQPTEEVLRKYGITSAAELKMEKAIMEGRMAIGAMAVSMFAGSMALFKVTGDYPYTKEDRDLWKANNVQPNSWVLPAPGTDGQGAQNKVYVSWKNVEIFNTLFSMTANVFSNQHILGEQLTDHWYKKISWLMASTIVEQSMLGGVEDLFNIWNPRTPEDAILRTGAKIIRSHIPGASLSAALGRIADNNLKEANTLMEQIFEHDVGFKSSMYPRYDILSKDRRGKRLRIGPDQPLLRLFNHISPVAITPVEGDFVKENLKEIRFNLPEILSEVDGVPLNSRMRSELEKQLSMGDLRRRLEHLFKSKSYQDNLQTYKDLNLKQTDGPAPNQGFPLRKQESFVGPVYDIFNDEKKKALNRLLADPLNADLVQQLDAQKAKANISKTGQYGRVQQQLENIQNLNPK